MNKIRKQIVLAAAVGMLAAGAAQAQARVEKNITLPLAMEAAAAAVASCTAGNYAVTATVVDRAGQIRAQLRADNAGPHTNDTSRRKAYMSATMRTNSGTIAENVAKNPGAAGVAQITDFIMLVGGVPTCVATPGDASVTNELRDEDALSSGSLLNRSRSTSVCIMESPSSRSPRRSTLGSSPAQRAIRTASASSRRASGESWAGPGSPAGGVRRACAPPRWA